jgi:class 3 adenylate cyclase
MGRTMAVVLFTDLVGSTELRGRLGEEAADELRRTHDQLLAQAVEASNGSVVKGLGDGVMATFAGAADAVAAAVAIQQAIDRLNRSGKAPVPLSVRVGLSAGDVSFEDDDVHGTPVIEASRLCGAAVGGEILASEIVRWLGGAQGAPSFIPVGSLELKGVAAPVPAGRIEWEPAPASTIPMPAFLTDIGRIFVGRDADLDRLGQLWKEAAAGERRVALLAGEPGVGKTRLAAELAIRIHDEGGVVLAGRCDEDMGVPYQPFVEALRHFVDHTSASDLKERLGRYGGELVRLVPDLSEQAPDLAPPLQSDPETERYRLFDAVTAWLSAASAEDALVLVLDDLQWAAKPTLLLLRHIVRASDTKRLLILGTYRDTELTHDHPLVELAADLRREGAVERLPLSGLDDLAVAAIVEQTAGQALSGEGAVLAHAIHQETEGNPFFVREVLRHLTETGVIERRASGWGTRLPVEELGIPESVRDVIGRRLSRLSEGANQTLRTAAVAGPEFEVPVVQVASGFDEDSLLTSLDEATGARLLIEATEAQRYRFVHALVRDTLYSQLSTARRAALHRRVAEAIEGVHTGRLDDYLPALAHHWGRANAPTAETRAVDYATRAGDRALAQLAHDEAVAYYRQARDLLDSTGPAAPGRRIGLLTALGEAQRRAGDPAHRETLIAAARLAQAGGDSQALARAALANFRGFMSITGGVDAPRVEMLEAALVAQDPGDGVTRARLMANLAAESVYLGDLAHCHDLARQAIAMARRLGDPPTLGHVLLSAVTPFYGPDTVEERLELTAEVVATAAKLGDPALGCVGHFHRFIAAMEVAEADEADRSMRRSQQLAGELGQPTLRWMAGFVTSNRELISGRIEGSTQTASEALELGRAGGQPDAELFFGVHVFNTHFEQGRLADIAERVQQVVGVSTGLPAKKALVALLWCELGRLEDARSYFEELMAELSTVAREVSWLRGTCVAAYICSHLADRSSASSLWDLLAPYAGLVACTGPSWFGAVTHHLATLATVLERWDEGEANFSAAAATHSTIGAPTWLARTRLEWARMLLTRHQPADADRARELLGQALATARELGLAKVERDAVTLLQ